jgi:hypothetical protein
MNQPLSSSSPTTSEAIDALRFLVKEASQPSMADSYVAVALMTARHVLERWDHAQLVLRQSVEDLTAEP